MLHVSEILQKRAESLELSPSEIARYSRHLLLPEVGISGQRRLKAARVLVIGVGGLGSPASLYLAAAGVGTIGLVEFDVVDKSNLQRQILYAESDEGQTKLSVAVSRLEALNSNVTLVPHAVRLDAGNVAAIFSKYDIIVDGTDNFPTRYLANDACVLLQKPYIYGSIFRFDGQASVFYTPHGPCYRCLFPSPPPPGQVPSCAEGGVLGVLPAQIGSIQANEVLKLILGIGEPLLGRLLTLNALDMKVDEFKINRDSHCPVCGDQPTITTLEESAASCSLYSARAPEVTELSAAELHSWRLGGKQHLLIDVRSNEEAEICSIAGSILVPLADLPGRLSEFPKNLPIVVHCKSGARSARAALVLKERGFQDVRSLKGGILEWAASYDPTLPRY